MKSRIGIISLIALLVVSCDNTNKYNEYQFIGEWQEVATNNESSVKMIDFNSDGTASSSGIDGIKYQNWALLNKKGKPTTIILSGEKVINKNIVNFSDTLKIISLNDDTLTLGSGDNTGIKFVKRDNDNNANGKSNELTYSKALDKNINLEKEAIRIASVENTETGYLVFATDSSTVDLFLPDGSSVSLDHRTNGKGQSAWNVLDDDTYNVRKDGNKWTVSRRQKCLYTSDVIE